MTLTQGYWLADSECTQALWLTVMGDSPSNFSGNPQLPVEQVTWGDSQRFMTALAKAPCRLPTEAEWECACRAGTTTPFSFGATITTAQANYSGLHPYIDGAPVGEDRKRTLPVKSLAMNAWGLYDMHGNVSEWCSDWYAFYPSAPASDPQGPAQASRNGPEHPFRGGSCDSHAANCRSASRMSRGPDYRGYNVGLRVLIAAAPEAAR